jgi:nicotinamide mononucleotide transporter
VYWLAGMPMSIGDVLGFATGLGCVWLTAIASLSLAAQWLLNRRALETWVFWIGVDVISVPLYLSRGLPLIAALFAIFLVLCVQGLRRWQRLVAPRATAGAA